MVKKTQQDNTEIRYVFDLAGRMTDRDCYQADGAQESGDSFTYDNASRLLTTDKGRYDIQTAHTYANDGHSLTETLTIDGRSYTMERTYDSAKRVETHKFADGKVMEWRYDDRNMVTKAFYDGEEVLDQIHDDAYRLTNQTFGQDLERVITFGRQDNLRTNAHVKDGSQIIDELDFDYPYAADKNVLSETNPSGRSKFRRHHDDGNRVKTWNRVADYLNARGSQTWNYDDAGNWNATIIDGDLQNRTNNGSDELTSIEGNALLYDSRGNLLEDQDGQKYTWDIDNRIATIEPANGSDEITHQYDAFSRRVHREFGNTEEVLLWWDKEEYAEHENIGSQPTIQNDLHANPSGLNTIFGRALEGSKHDTQYFHKNYLDHVYAVIDDRGDIIEHYRYTAFCEPEFYNEFGQQLTGSAIDNDILWNVKRYSEASGLYMYLYRHYEAEHGRWPSRDPIAEEGGVNLYGFVGGKPYSYIDIWGLSKEKEVVTIGIVIGPDIDNSILSKNTASRVAEEVKSVYGEEVTKYAKIVTGFSTNVGGVSRTWFSGAEAAYSALKTRALKEYKQSSGHECCKSINLVFGRATTVDDFRRFVNLASEKANFVVVHAHGQPKWDGSKQTGVMLGFKKSESFRGSYYAKPFSLLDLIGSDYKKTSLYIMSCFDKGYPKNVGKVSINLLGPGSNKVNHFIEVAQGFKSLVKSNCCNE